MNKEPTISPLSNHSFMNDLFPFYILVNRELEVINLGDSQKKISVIAKGDHFLSSFHIERPLNITSFDDIIRQSSSLFIFTSKLNKHYKFRGQLYHYENTDLICFLGSPLINSFEELKTHDLTLNDFAIFDNISQFLFTLQMQITALKDSKAISTKLREYKDQLEKSLKETEKAKLNQQSFFAKMSHELRTPLNAIIGMSELLQATELDQTQKKYLRAVSFSSNSLLRIINDILDFSKLKTDQFSLENINFSLKQLIKEVYHSSIYTAREKNIQLTYFISEDIIHCYGDSLRITQVLVNLVNNAIKFTNQGSIDIRIDLLSESQNYQIIEFSVTDTGKGISKDKLERIFNSYEQEDEGISREFGGTGLGLTIAKEIVEKYDSTINVESEEGKGSRFFFVLKLAKIREVGFKLEETKVEYDFQDIRILLVEDNHVNRFYAETILVQKDIIVEMAEDGSEAVNQIQNNQYDLILMDMQMPVMNGLTATKIIRTQFMNETPIIGLSANTVTEDINNCFEVGMNGYVAKPFEPDVLFNKIAEILKLKAIKNGEKEEVITEPAYSLEKIKTTTNGNPSLTIKLLELFIEQVPKDIKLMKEHIVNKDYNNLFGLAHKNKPTFGVLGMNRGEELCRTIENFDHENSEQKLLTNFFNELEKLVESSVKDFKKEIEILAS